MSKRFLWLLLTIFWGGCTSYPRPLNLPFDRQGRSFNSGASELTPQINSQYVVFASDRNGSQDIYLYDLRNRRLVDLPGLNALNAIASHPSLSEDGRYIAFAASVEGRSGIYLYDRQTQQKRLLTEKIAAEVRHPTMSGDGERIAFEVGIDGQWDLMVCDRFGKLLDIPGTPR